VTYGNPFATGADRYADGRPYHHERTVRRALASRPGSALDVACGTGLSTRALAALGIPVVGLDPVPAMVARARADTGLPYLVGAAEAVPVRSAAVDLVTVSSGVHWFDPDRFAAEAARVLRPGGTLLLYEHAGADLPAEPAFRDWMRGTYSCRYPAPARGATADAFDGRGRFRVEASDRWPDEVRFDRAGFAAYLLTQSNLLDEEPEPVRAWLLDQLAPFFPVARTVTFTASYRRLRL
jgi:SAM-dependent methyltransferase